MDEPAHDLREDPDELLRRLRASVGREGATEASRRYEVETEIARGGMGIVLQVRDARMRRVLAMKVLRTPEADEEHSADSTFESKFSARFLEEAQVTGQLDHPGIVPVHELGLDAEDRLYFTMPLVKGRTLGEVFALARAEDSNEGWTLARALGVVLKVCEAMAYAHDHDVIHRDLKPANVMVGRFGETYVMDWGLAKILGRPEREVAKPDVDSAQTIMTSTRKEETDESHASALTTLDGDVIGTPAYMAPEQAQGRVGDVGPLADVYSVGALLYHALAGHAPYLEPGIEVPVYTVLEWVREGPPEPLGADVPGELVAICEKAMAREPSQRYASMLDLGEDLRAFLEGRVVAAYRTGAVAEFRKWVTRNRGLAASLAAALVVGFVGLASVVVVQTRARDELASKNQELSQTNDDLAVARDAAQRSERLALEQGEEVVWQSYVGNIGAAGASLALGNARDVEERLAACAPEHRGWEWRYLENAGNASLATRTVTDESFVFAVAYDPRGRYIATGTANIGDIGGSDFRVRLWDAETLEHVRDFESPESPIYSLDFSPAGTELVCGTLAATTHLWDVESGEELSRMGRMGSIVAFHPGGLHVAVVGSGNQVQTWDLLTNQISFRSPTGRARAVAFSPDGRWLAVGLVEPRLLLWDLEAGTPSRAVEFGAIANATRGAGVGAGVMDLEFGADGRLLVSLGVGDALVLDPETGESELALIGHDRAVTAAGFSPDGRQIVTSSMDGTLRIWSGEDGALLEILYGHSQGVRALDLGPSGHRIVSGSSDGTIRLWDGRPGSAVTTLQGTGENAFTYYDARFDPSGTRLAWRSDPKTWDVVDARTGETLLRLPSMESPLQHLGFDATGERILTAGSEDYLRTWDAETGELLSSSADPLPPLGTGIFSPDGTVFAGWVVPSPSMMRLWDVETGEVLMDHPVVDGYYAAFSPDGKLLAWSAHTGEVPVWDVERGELLRLVHVPDRTFCVTFSSDGTLLAATTYDTWDETIYLFDVGSGELVRELRGPTQPALLEFLPDDSRIVSANWDGTLSLWHPVRGEVYTLAAHDSIVMALDVAPDGTRIASGESGGRHRIWDTTPVGERAEVREAAARRSVLQPRARALVDGLLETYLLKPDIAQRLRRDESLSDDLREAALRLLWSERFVVSPEQGEAAGSPAGSAFVLLLDPDGTPDQYLRALRTLERVFELSSRSDESELWVMLGFAQLRMGRLDEAMQTLEAAGKYSRGPSTSFAALVDVITALCHMERGELDRAEPIVTRWRRSLSSARSSRGTPEIHFLLQAAVLRVLDEVESKMGS
jgi:WD40 repeat protein/tRNA A-37 threonylcarbamoyl transferase component Bud32